MTTILCWSKNVTDARHRMTFKEMVTEFGKCLKTGKGQNPLMTRGTEPPFMFRLIFLFSRVIAGFGDGMMYPVNCTWKKSLLPKAAFSRWSMSMWQRPPARVCEAQPSMWQISQRWQTNYTKIQLFLLMHIAHTLKKNILTLTNVRIYSYTNECSNRYLYWKLYEYSNVFWSHFCQNAGLVLLYMFSLRLPWRPLAALLLSVPGFTKTKVPINIYLAALLLAVPAIALACLLPLPETPYWLARWIACNFYPAINRLPLPGKLLPLPVSHSCLFWSFHNFHPILYH